MKCPVCRATYRPAIEPQTSKTEENPAAALLCHRCGADLSSLIQLHDQAIWYQRQAIQAFQIGDYPAATEWNRRALTLWNRNADFHALAGQLWALQGEFGQAIAAWKTAQTLDPRQPVAETGLQQVMQFLHSDNKSDSAVEPG